MESTFHFENKEKFIVSSLNLECNDVLKFTFACSLSYLETVKQFIGCEKSISEIAYDITSSFFTINRFGNLELNEKYSVIFTDIAIGSELEFELLNAVIKKINEDFNIPSKMPEGK